LGSSMGFFGASAKILKLLLLSAFAGTSSNISAASPWFTVVLVGVVAIVVVIGKVVVVA
jgi:hypothetical protein